MDEELKNNNAENMSGNVSDNPVTPDLSAEAVNDELTNGEKVEAEKTDLGDISRVKVLSPGRLVVKRFMRNRLAIVGACVLIFMFVFALLGPVISPYGESQTFQKFEYTNSAYLSATLSGENVFYSDGDGALTETQTRDVGNKLKELSAEESAGITSGDADILVEKISEYSAELSVTQNEESKVASFTYIMGTIVEDKITFEAEYASVAGLREAIIANVPKDFTFDGKDYYFTREGRTYVVNTKKAIGSFTGVSTFVNIYFDDGVGASDSEITPDFTLNGNNDIKRDIIRALSSGKYVYNNTEYTVEPQENGDVHITSGGKVFAFVTPVRMVTAKATNELFLDAAMRFSKEVRAMSENVIDTHSYTADVIVMSDEKEAYERIEGGEVSVTLNRGVYSSTVMSSRMLIDINGAPSKEHWLGTDGNGMDNLTRMMYGGRVSLMVGFIVIIIEMLIGVIMGGIAGYFGGWVDMLIMRIVDIINCVPFMPVMIILGSVFDAIGLSPWLRIIYIMMIMGLVSWTGTARLVRGQILSLREQEYMQAAEATGLSVPRRIFKHLVPNVMPQLIVSATMGLGDVIIMESTLSFLGLGCKYPMSSWGTIINSVNTQFGLVHYAYVWIPVGLLISLTVIAFNFIGDGLRDAFDPKMKR